MSFWPSILGRNVFFKVVSHEIIVDFLSMTKSVGDLNQLAFNEISVRREKLVSFVNF